MFIYRISATICPKNLILVIKLLFEEIDHFDLLDFKKNLSFIFCGGFCGSWDCFLLTVILLIMGSVTVEVVFC